MFQGQGPQTHQFSAFFQCFLNQTCVIVWLTGILKSGESPFALTGRSCHSCFLSCIYHCKQEEKPNLDSKVKKSVKEERWFYIILVSFWPVALINLFDLEKCTEFSVFLYYSLQLILFTQLIFMGFFPDLHICGWKHHLLASTHWIWAASRQDFYSYS